MRSWICNINDLEGCGVTNISNLILSRHQSGGSYNRWWYTILITEEIWTTWNEILCGYSCTTDAETLTQEVLSELKWGNNVGSTQYFVLLIATVAWFLLSRQIFLHFNSSHSLLIYQNNSKKLLDRNEGEAWLKKGCILDRHWAFDFRKLLTILTCICCSDSKTSL